MGNMKSFLNYYRDELISLRKSGGAFAKAHPDIASRLDIRDGESSDPHTERIIESVAFMSAKLHQKIDGNSQEIASYLLSALYPNLINIFPPCSVAKFEASNAVLLSEKIVIPKCTNLFATSVTGAECSFRTVYQLNIYPITITGICLAQERRSAAAGDWYIKINISNRASVPLENIGISDLLFHIKSEITDDALLVYSAIFANHDRSVFLRVGNRDIEINPENVTQCGFSHTESVCPVSKYSTNALQLFQEMLHFKRKFMFFRILNLDKAIEESGVSGIEDISIFVGVRLSDDRLRQLITTDSIIINSTPIVNLFPVTSDPFRFDGVKTKYLLLADQSRDRSIEIHSILNAHMIDSSTRDDTIIQPYFSLSVDTDTNIEHDVFWLSSKDSASIRNLNGFDTYISLVDAKMDPFKTYDAAIYAKTLCTNRFEARDIPTLSKMTVGTVETAGYDARLLYNTSPPVSFTDNSTALWELISQLSSSHVSMAGASNILLQIKKLVDIFWTQPSGTGPLDGIADIKISDIVRRFGKDAWRGFVRGREIAAYTNEPNGAPLSYLCCCVLNQYFSSIISLNSFVQLNLISCLSGQKIATWAPTSGRSELL
ncbi:MAG: type VI secretion system baseplate subunit TssF [Holosporales bacterium]|jgi:type VI secretion system protein ImpG|nr:type VI secretion system baseplate subunit TssF [Holosporales bacterium]